jgi:hydroxymethylbilane synthase
MPLAAHAVWQADRLALKTAWGDPDGSAELVTADGDAVVSSLAQAEALGRDTSALLCARGARVMPVAVG